MKHIQLYKTYSKYRLRMRLQKRRIILSFKYVFRDRVARVFAKIVLAASLLIVSICIVLPLYNASIKYNWIDAQQFTQYDHLIDFRSEVSLVSYCLYFMEICTTTFFFLAFVLTRKRFYIFFTALYLMVFLDDYFQIHEKFGKLLSENLDLINIFSLRKQDTGELITWFIMACILLPLAIKSFRKLIVFDRFYCLAVAVSFAILLVCGLGIDMVSILASGTGIMKYAIGIVEDGGEMIAIALTLALAFSGFKRSCDSKLFFKNQSNN